VSPIEILKAARELLAMPGAWTKGHYAKNSSGYQVYPFEPEAACFCSYGAMSRFAAEGGTANLHAAEDAVRAQVPNGDLIGFNDAQESVEPVLAAFDRAIAKLESST
jgi:hypothetical protein